MSAQKQSRLTRLHRIKQIEKMLILGLDQQEMADRLGVNERTIRRDLDWRYEELQKDGGKQVATHRSALLAELGRTYSEAVQNYQAIQARNSATDEKGNPLFDYVPTFPYLNTRIRAMGLMAKLTGAEIPTRMILQGKIHVHHQGEVNVQMIPEAEMLDMQKVMAQIALEAPRFHANGGNGNGTNGNN